MKVLGTGLAGAALALLAAGLYFLTLPADGPEIAVPKAADESCSSCDARHKSLKKMQERNTTHTNGPNTVTSR